MRPHTTYLICASPRCGSTLLCEVLYRSGLAGKPREVFNPDLEAGEAEAWGVSSYAAYYERAIADGISPDGVFGTKLMWLYMERVTGKLRDLFAPHLVPVVWLLSRARGWLRGAPPDPERDASVDMARTLARAFPNLHYIWITRRDTVRQAVSLYRALQTGVWLQRIDEPSPPLQEGTFDFETIQWLLHNVVRENDEGWRTFFDATGIEPYRVEYEDLAQRDEEVARDILCYLQIPLPANHTFAERILRKQADALSEEWVQRYHQLARQNRVATLA